MNATAVRDITGQSLRDSVSEVEWKVRVDLAAAYRPVSYTHLTLPTILRV